MTMSDHSIGGGQMQLEIKRSKALTSVGAVAQSVAVKFVDHRHQRGYRNHYRSRTFASRPRRTSGDDSLARISSQYLDLRIP